MARNLKRQARHGRAITAARGSRGCGGGERAVQTCAAPIPLRSIETKLLGSKSLRHPLPFRSVSGHFGLLCRLGGLNGEFPERFS
jgi:hypothetical protein